MHNHFFKTDLQIRDGWRELYHLLSYHMHKGVRLMPEEQQPFFTGYEYGTLYDWDQYFEGLIQLYLGWPTLHISNAILMFLNRQDERGHIGRSVPDRWRHDMVKPFLAQLALCAYHADRDLLWLTGEPYLRMTRYLDNWMDAKDRRGGGLSTWMSAGHSGMDNQHERAGSGTDAFCEAVDLNAYLVREARAMARLAELMNRPDDATRFTQRAEQRATAVREQLWHEEDGFFYDRDARDGSWIKVGYAGAFAALWAGVATAEQAKRMVQEHLLNEARFKRPWPVPALSADAKGYHVGFAAGDHPRCCSWRAHTWIPTNYYTVAGLRRYGFAREADWITDRTWEMFLTHPFYEYYVTESGLGTGLRPFWGWSSLAMFMPIEAKWQLDPTDLAADNSAIARMRQAVRELLYGSAILA